MFTNLNLVHEILHYRKFSSTKSLLQYLKKKKIHREHPLQRSLSYDLELGL